MYSSISKTSVSWSNHGLSVMRRNSLLPHPYGGSVTLNALQLLSCTCLLLGPTYAPSRCGPMAGPCPRAASFLHPPSAKGARALRPSPTKKEETSLLLRLQSVLQHEGDLQVHLVTLDVAVLDHDVLILDPSTFYVPQGLVGAGYGLLDGVLKALL